VPESSAGRPNIRLLASSLLFCAILATLLAYAGAVLKPVNPLWSGYLQQPRGTVDVLLFGNSHVFDGIDPTVFWERRGVTGYVMAGPVQPPRITQHYVRETLRTQHPKVVLVDMSSLSYDQSNYVKSFQQTNVGYMPWGVNKLRAALVDTPAADRVGVLVDLWSYHSRWTKMHLRDLDLSSHTGPGDATMKGWQPILHAHEITQTQPASTTPSTHTVAAVDANIPALRSIAQTCRDNGAQLLLILTPTSPPNQYSWQLNRARAALAADYPEVRALDLSIPGAVPGLDWSKDFYDRGHLSYTGSAKASATIADFLARTYHLASHRADPAYAFWNRDAALHDAKLRALARQTR
jgi:hypothetical protein